MKFFTKTYILVALIFLPVIAGAQVVSPNPVGVVSSPNPVGVVVSPNPVFQFDNPLSVNTICGALSLFLKALLTLAIPVAVLFLVYSGFLFVWARGSKDGLIKAKRNLVYTIIGIAIFMGAWLIGQVIMNTLNELSRDAGQPNSQISDCR